MGALKIGHYILTKGEHLGQIERIEISKIPSPSPDASLVVGLRKLTLNESSFLLCFFLFLTFFSFFKKVIKWSSNFGSSS